jgi:hypothetical protein
MLLFALLFPLYVHALEPLLVVKPAVPPSVAPTQVVDPEVACAEAEKKLRLFSAGYRVYCLHDKDCDSYQISQSPCAAPMVLRKSHEVLGDKDLQKLQASSAAVCAAPWSKLPACTRPKPRPVCREGKCVDGGSLPGSVK